MIDRVEHKRKMEQMLYYHSPFCVCGKQKKENRWLCLVCKDRTLNTPEELDVAQKCKSHLDAVDIWLAKAKEMALENS